MDIPATKAKMIDLTDRFCKKFGFRFIDVNSKDPLMLRDDSFIAIYNMSAPFTITSLERMFALYQSVKYVVSSNIEGDFVECGVWKGGSVMLMALTLKEMGVKSKRIYLYDTFNGNPPPGKDEFLFSNGVSALFEYGDGRRGEWEAPLSSVRENIAKTGYPLSNFEYVIGEVEKTLRERDRLPKKIAILRLDTDYYESTKTELENLFPLLQKGGVLIIDDYGHYSGAKRAVDEYVSENNISILLNRIDYTGRIGVKT